MISNHVDQLIAQVSLTAIGLVKLTWLISYEV